MLLETDESLSKLNRLAIFSTNFRNNAGNFGFYLVHDLHGFNNANDSIGSDFLAYRDKWRGIR